MKRAILLLLGLLFITNYTGAQLLEKFEKAGSLGVFKDAAWGTLTDSIYQTQDPTGKSAGVMGVHFNLKGSAAHNAIRPVTQSFLDPKGAHHLVYWIYIPLNSLIPDSLVIGLWWQVNGNWTWNEYDYFAKDIPKGVWYPLSCALLDSAIADPSNDGFNGHILGDFGIQWNNEKVSAVGAVWQGDIYFDNVSLVGAKPATYANFLSGVQGFSEMWSNGWVDSISHYSGMVGDSSGALEWKLINGSASTGGVALGIQPGNYDASTKHFFVYWIYVDSTFPDTARFQTWAQDNSTWNWPGPRGIGDYLGSNIPRNKWFPIYFDLMQASIADTVSGSEFNSIKHPLGKFGIQVYGTKTWKGSIFLRSVQLTDSVYYAGSKAAWLAADFEKSASGTQGFYVPSVYVTKGVSYLRGIDALTGNHSFVLKLGVDFSQEKKIVIQRDSVPIVDLSDAGIYATQAAFRAYFPSTMEQGAAVDYAISGPATSNKLIQVEKKLDNSALLLGQWNTLSLNLDSLVQSGKVNPLKPATIAVQISYPAGDTTTWAGTILFDSLVFAGISRSAELPTAVNGNNGIVREFKLYTNYPNPFNPSTVIKYDLPSELNVTLRVYDILGREVETLVNNQKQVSGTYNISFDASRFASGVYIYKLTAGSYTKSYKMMLLK